MIDTHAHIDLCDDPVDDVVGRAREAGLERILTIGLGPKSHQRTLDLSAKYRDVFAALGWHPYESSSFTAEGAVAVEKVVEQGSKVCAIGEAGLDYHREHTPKEIQKQAFIGQIELAKRLRLPLLIHTREAEHDTYAILAEHGDGLDVVIHCFSAPEYLDICLERGYYCSFAGNVTYPNAADLQQAAKRVPDELLLVETDAPYLTPQSLRGKRNQPANVCETAGYLAELRGQSYLQLEEIVETNAAKLFGW